MKLGMNTDGVGHLSLDATLDLAAELGLDCIEFATGAWSSAPHLNLGALTTKSARGDLLARVADRGLTISALTCSGNPLDPGPSGAKHDRITRETLTLAGQLGVDRVVMMSGLPGGPGDKHPNWIVVGWPPEASAMLEWQWTDALLPYWRELVSFAAGTGVEKIALELHAQQLVYNVPTLLRLRDVVGPIVGANLDPSHLFWMGADPVAAARVLKEAVHYVHAKDTRIEEPVKLTGTLESMSLFTEQRAARAWNYVTLGQGHGDAFWTSFVAALKDGGYDGVLSIEHEDPAFDVVTGLRESVDVLRAALANNSTSTTHA